MPRAIWYCRLLCPWRICSKASVLCLSTCPLQQKTPGATASARVNIERELPIRTASSSALLLATGFSVCWSLFAFLRAHLSGKKFWLWHVKRVQRGAPCESGGFGLG